jgi:D-psicose/D-tagatose/L-ribulose 3-epimerase
MARTSRPTVAPFRKRDPGRAQRAGSSTSAIADVRRHLSHVHISENDRGTPGRGHIDFAAAFRALKGSGYDGWLTIEAFGRALPPLAAATRVWRDFFPTPTQVYREGYKFIRSGWDKA